VRKVEYELFAGVGGADPDDFMGIDHRVDRRGGQFTHFPRHEEGMEDVLLCRLLDFLMKP